MSTITESKTGLPRHRYVNALINADKGTRYLIVGRLILDTETLNAVNIDFIHSITRLNEDKFIVHVGEEVSGDFYVHKDNYLEFLGVVRALANDNE